MKTAIVILNWNGEDFLRRFLPGLVESVRDYDAQVIIADNASTDGSLQYLKEFYPDLRTIVLDMNYGFTGGYNKAFDQIGDEAEYYLLINSDIEVQGDWLYPLEEWMDLHEDCGVCVPKLHSYTDRDRFEYAGAAGGMLDHFGYPFCRGRVLKRTEIDEGQYDIPAEVMWGTGACLMVRSWLWHELGGFDERFFAHMEEIDLCWRVRLSGYKVNVVPRSLVWHVGGGTLPQDSPRKLFLNYRNNLLMLRNNLAFTIALQNLYDVLSTQTDDMEVSTDGFLNCMEVYDSMSEFLQDKLLDACIDDAISSAGLRIKVRLFLDWCSSVVYLFKGQKEYRKSVHDAHREYRALKSDIDKAGIRELLVNEVEQDCPAGRVFFDIDTGRKRKERVLLKGMIDQSIVLLEAAYKDDVFEYLRDITI